MKNALPFTNVLHLWAAELKFTPSAIALSVVCAVAVVALIGYLVYSAKNKRNSKEEKSNVPDAANDKDTKTDECEKTADAADENVQQTEVTESESADQIDTVEDEPENKVSEKAEDIGENHNPEPENAKANDENNFVSIIRSNGDSSPKFAVSRYKRSFMSKLIQSDDELKGYYGKIKNEFMSYEKVTSIVSREQERIRNGRTTIGIIKLRGKTILLYLPLNPAEFENTMYAGEDASSIGKYADVPFLYSVKGPRKADRAVRLISMAAEKIGLQAKAEKANEDYIASMPYESDDELIAKGLITDTESK